MAMNQYIGERYTTLFADPIEWDNTRTYESLTVVMYQGASYVSRRPVPAAIDISDTRFWLMTFNYNAQVELYRQEVRQYDARITQAQGDATDAKDAAESAQELADTANDILAGYAEGDTVKADISTLQTAIGNVDTKVGTLPEGQTSVVGYVGGETQRIDGDITDLETTLTGFSPQNQVKTYIDNAIGGAHGDMVIIGDSFTSDYYVSDADLWYHPVADALGCTPHNYSERGSGFTRAGNGGNTFKALAEAAAADNTFDNANVKWLFVYGGLNDIDHANADMAFGTDFNTFCNYVHTTFPNAQFVVCGINAWKTGFSFFQNGTNYRGQIFYEQTMKSQTGFLNAHGIFISMCGALGFNSSWYDSNNNHPNSTGHKALANWILSALFSNGLCRSTSTTFSIYESNAAGAGNLTLHMRPGSVEYSGQTTAAQANEYVLDGFGFFKDQAVDVRGLVIGTDRSGTHVFGWLGAHNSAGYINTVENGFFHGVRNF